MAYLMEETMHDLQPAKKTARNHARPIGKTERCQGWDAPPHSPVNLVSNRASQHRFLL
jgi:hypothetical protein